MRSLASPIGLPIIARAEAGVLHRALLEGWHFQLKGDKGERRNGVAAWRFP